MPASADEYRWVEADERLDGFCVTVVEGVPLDEVVRRFDGDLATATEATFAESFNGAPEPTYVLVGQSGAGVVVAENNGWWGVQDEIAVRVSRGGRLVAYYRSVNADMTFVHAVDGTFVAWFDPLLDDVPAGLEEVAAGLDFAAERVGATSFALMERLTGIRVEQDWLLDEPHVRVDVPSPY